MPQLPLTIEYNKVDICIRKMSLLHLIRLLSLPSQEMIMSGTSHGLISKQSIKRLTTWIIYSSLDKNTSFYILTSEKVIYLKPVALSILL